MLGQRSTAELYPDAISKLFSCFRLRQKIGRLGRVTPRPPNASSLDPLQEQKDLVVEREGRTVSGIGCGQSWNCSVIHSVMRYQAHHSTHGYSSLQALAVKRAHCVLQIGSPGSCLGF